MSCKAFWNGLGGVEADYSTQGIWKNSCSTAKPKDGTASQTFCFPLQPVLNGNDWGYLTRGIFS